MNNVLANVVCAVAPDQREVNRLAAQYAVAFQKTHLAGEKGPGYQRVLTPGWALTMEENIEFFVTEPANAAALGEDPIDEALAGPRGAACANDRELIHS